MTKLRQLPLAVAAALALGGAGAASAADQAPLRRWTDGPVRYVATAAEISAFKKLRTDGSRAAFVETFWARRDPTPETIHNEYRQLFWERVRDANALFTDRPGEGWKTDRGKIYILHGPPSRIEDDLHANTQESAGAGRGLIRWIYDQRPEGRATATMGPTVVVPFVRDATGEYRLSHDPRLASTFYRWDDIQLRSQYEDWLGVDIVNTSETPLGVMLDMGRMQELPTQAEVLLERVQTAETFSHTPLRTTIHQYRHPDETGTVVTLTVAIPESLSETRPALIARFLPEADANRSYVIDESSFKVAGAGNERLAQARLVMDPGTYVLTVLAVPPHSSHSSLHRETLAVRPDPAGFSLSDLTLAQELEPVPYKALRSYDEPYVVGSFRVVPRTDDRVRRGEDVAVFFEVYGGTLPYRVTYRLETRRGEDWVALGQPMTQEGGQGAQGWAVPTSERWPLGRYRVRVEVDDAEARSRTALIEFELIETPGTA